MKHHVVQFSTGAGSAEVAYRVVAQHGPENVVLLTADTRVEDADNWRFACEVVADLGMPEWQILTDGRTPMQVGRDHRCVPNNRMAVCSRILKRELLNDYMTSRWLRDEGATSPAGVTVYLGFDWTEEHRLIAHRSHSPWHVEAPLCDPPYLTKAQMLEAFRAIGIEPPRLYAMGFSHANCGGACVRGGQAQWELLLRVNPSRYREWEAEEHETRVMLGKDVTILRDRARGTSTPLSLRSFRERLERSPSLFDSDEWGACGCTEETVA